MTRANSTRCHYIAGANYQDYLIGVQSVVIDAKDRLWILDTGRALTPSGTQVPASYGGPKLIGVNLSNDTVFATIVFPSNVAYSDSVSATHGDSGVNQLTLCGRRVSQRCSPRLAS